MAPRPLRFLARQLADLALGAVVTVAIFLVAEGALRLAGADEIPVAPRHLRAALSEEARVFEVDPEADGGWRWRHGAPGGYDRTIPPRSEATRVLLFGGSNTEGFPQRVLERELEERSGREFEVLNLGRSGYGSTRVATVFREAVATFAPDAAVVYAGHNEFVEKSFAMDLERAWGNPLEAAAARALQATVTGRMLTGLLSEDEPEYARIQDWEREYQKFADVTYDETLRVWEAYEENLRYMASLAEEQGVPLLLCTPVWNRLSPPRVGTPPPEADPADVERASQLHDLARGSYPEPLAVLLPPRDKDRVHSFDWGRNQDRLPPGERMDPLPGARPGRGWLADVEPRFRTGRRWRPEVRAWYEALAWLHGERTDREREALEEARGLLEQALELRPDDPHLIYEAALVRRALGERGEAQRRDLARAARLDRAPRRANPESNDRVRAVAADRAGVRLYDTDARFAEGAAEGVVGWEWMCDHCHLNEGAKIVLMEDLAAEILALLEAGG